MLIVLHLSMATILADLLVMGALFIDSVLTHSFPMHPVSTSSKHQKTLRFPHVFKGLQKAYIENEWVNISLYCSTYQTSSNISYRSCISLLYFSYK